MADDAMQEELGGNARTELEQFISREAKSSIDEGETADPKLAEFLKGRKQQKAADGPLGDAA